MYDSFWISLEMGGKWYELDKITFTRLGPLLSCSGQTTLFFLLLCFTYWVNLLEYFDFFESVFLNLFIYVLIIHFCLFIFSLVKLPFEINGVILIFPSFIQFQKNVSSLINLFLLILTLLNTLLFYLLLHTFIN